MPQRSDEELFTWMRTELTTCAVSDVMGQLGFGCALLPLDIRPLRRDMRIVGRAMPVQDDEPVPYGTPTRFDAKPFGLMLESIETLRPGEIYLASGGPITSARLGDLLIARARRLGAAGVVLNARARGAEQTLALDFPVFARGSCAFGLQHRHNVVDFRCAITIGEVRVKPGDLIFGDRDGVCVIPSEAEAEILDKAALRNGLEKRLRADIDAGLSLFEAFDKYQLRG